MIYLRLILFSEVRDNGAAAAGLLILPCRGSCFTPALPDVSIIATGATAFYADQKNFYLTVM